jgi:hypothetical protein
LAVAVLMVLSEVRLLHLDFLVQGEVWAVLPLPKVLVLEELLLV